MSTLLLFWQSSRFLSPEWLSSASGIAITYIIFVMGLPSLIFQTFIPEGLRTIYNERFKNKWNFFFQSQLGLAILIFLLGNPYVNSLLVNYFAQIRYGKNAPTASTEFGERCIAILIFSAIVFILFQGYFHLMRNFKSTRNVAQRIANAIVKNAIKHYDKQKDIEKKDFEDLSAIAKELKAGQLKNEFLEECECLLEHLLNAAPQPQNVTLVKRLLDEVICLSVMYDGSLSNQDNRRKVLDILNLVNGHKTRPKIKKRSSLLPQKLRYPKSTAQSELVPIEHQSNDLSRSSDYSRTHIGYHTKELGINALKNGDVNSALEAIEQLYSIDADPKDLFAICSYAIQHNNMGIAVSAFQKLRSKLQDCILSVEHSSGRDLRIFYFWFGILTLLDQRGGAARAHAQRRWDQFREKNLDIQTDSNALFQKTYEHFVRLTDFDTADVVKNYLNAQA
jgi:hypothetical protein